MGSGLVPENARSFVVGAKNLVKNSFGRAFSGRRINLSLIRSVIV